MTTIFPYSWNLVDSEELSEIRAYGIDDESNSICLRIQEFSPYVYVELPQHWGRVEASMLCDKVDELMRANFKPLRKVYTHKYNLYYANLTPNNKRRTTPYVFFAFRKEMHRRLFCKMMRRQFFINGETVRLRVHQQKASPFLQFIAQNHIHTAGWNKFSTSTILEQKDRVTTCRKEYVVQWKDVKPVVEDREPAVPVILSFDLEVNSTDRGSMPNFNKFGDKIFQISCVYGFQGDPMSEWFSVLLTLGSVGDNKCDFTVEEYPSEAALLCGFVDLVKRIDANVLIGYNIFGFDIPYLVGRSKYLKVYDEMMSIGMNLDSMAVEKEVKWSSSAYKDQEFVYLDAQGRLFIDLLPLVKRDYKLDNYKLDTVAQVELGKEKDPLTAMDIFACYRQGVVDGDNERVAYVGKYCVKDSALVLELFEHFLYWNGLTEMASICKVPISSLYLHGQQIKVYSQVYEYCTHNNIVVQGDMYKTPENMGYQGAYVFEPVPGLYDKVIPLDFASLYPSTMIANNIDYSTYIQDKNVPDEACNVIEWSEHIGCIHDTVVRKTAPKHVLCGDRRFRFLKEPRGVMPTIAENLLRARKKTKKQMKTLDSDDPIRRVLDKRQLAYKVSCNSVRADTPIPCQINDVFCYRKIEDLASSGWKRINPEQEVALPIPNLKVWSDKGFTHVKYVMRHPNEEILTRVVTHTGIVDCTKDHSLLRDDGTPVKPSQLSVGERLLHKDLPLPSDTPLKPLYDNMMNNVTMNHPLLTELEEQAFCWGLFFAEGTCGHWGSIDEGKKNSWAIYNVDIQLLEKVREILVRIEEPWFSFEISNLYENQGQGIYHLRGQGDVKRLTAKYRALFYDSRGYKIVPDQILNATLDIRLAFFLGYYVGDGAQKGVVINNRGLIGTASLVYLAQSLGYKTSLARPKDNSLDMTRVQCCLQKRRNVTAIKQMDSSPDLREVNLEIRNGEEILFKNGQSSYRGIGCSPIYIPSEFNEVKLFNSETIEYVYDIETANHHFAAGIGNLIIHNSLYGAFGVREGYLPFMPAAASITAKGREYIQEVARILKDDYNGHVVTGDTDSCLVNFPTYNDKPIPELWDYSVQVTKEISACFKHEAMILEFEDKIYHQFLTLTKKRYMSTCCDREGNMELDKNGNVKLASKGVLLSRRDNSGVIRMTYTSLVQRIFDKVDIQFILDEILTQMNRIASRYFTLSEYSLTKSVGSINNYVLNPNDDNKTAQMGSYKVKLLSDDPEIQSTQLSKKNVTTAKDFYLSQLPAVVQLAEKMKRRGELVPAGSRLPYIISRAGGNKALQGEKIEDLEYASRHVDYCKPEMLYYIKQLIQPVDELLEVVYSVDKFVKGQYKYRLKREQCLDELITLFKPVIEYEEEKN